MKPRQRRWMRSLGLAICTLPLLVTGPCLTITTESLLGGALDGLTIQLVEQAGKQWGLSKNTGENVARTPAGLINQ